MPIYEYQCTDCHNEFDLLERMTDKPTTVCPKCSKNTAVRLVSAVAFQLKGNGWYATDFKNTTRATNKESDASGQEATSDSENKTQETKSQAEKKSTTSTATKPSKSTEGT